MFQFTHPGRGATLYELAQEDGFTGFNSRTPGGVRRVRRRWMTSILKFQFTHPGRGATKLTQLIYDCFGVSIHAPREGCDASTLAQNKFIDEFQFTHPGRGATPRRSMHHSSSSLFQFTHPGRGATSAIDRAMTAKGVSIHAPREGCD